MLVSGNGQSNLRIRNEAVLPDLGEAREEGVLMGKSSPRPHLRLPREYVQSMVVMRQNGMKLREISAEVGLSQGRICVLLQRAEREKRAKREKS